MDDRVRAKGILRQARQILAERLIERVIEAGDELLDDARGESYSGEIDAIYEQIAGRLQRVNAMLAELPSAEGEFANADAATSAASRGRARLAPGAFQADTTAAAPSLDVASLAARFGVPQADWRRASWDADEFLERVAASDVAAAGRLLAAWLDLDPRVGADAAEFFRGRWTSAEGVSRIRELQDAVGAGNNIAALAALRDCFGLQGWPAIVALQGLLAGGTSPGP